MRDTLAIQLQDLHRSFGRNRAVDGVSFDVLQGEIFSLLAPTAPGAWVVDAYENVVQRGLGVPSVLLSCSLLTASAAGLAVLAALRFHRQSA
jgi:hypothetical protein